jgi:hypothetical protein
MKAGRLSGGPRGPGLPREVQTITGLTAPTGLGGPDPPPPGKGSGVATCRPRGGSGADPAMCPWQEALHGSPAHLPAFNAVIGLGAPKSKSIACH